MQIVAAWFHPCLLRKFHSSRLICEINVYYMKQYYQRKQSKNYSYYISQYDLLIKYHYALNIWPKNILQSVSMISIDDLRLRYFYY